MKHILLIRGEESDTRSLLLSQLMQYLNPDINHVRAIKVSMNDYGSLLDKGERKAAASNVKKLIRRLLAGSHQEQFIIIDNPNMNPNDWMPIFAIADELKCPISSIGINVRKNEQSSISDEKYEKTTNVQLFKATMHKYHWVKTDSDIAEVLDTLSGLMV